ncbi:hypothetical protein HMPREF9080_00624 [Cardiobacterium valvarum F0432]|uniref:Uncharacterized protein n=1 Tax=Cardiobacterium valvarum F0432 TaxID=797473 RepID=G9ZCZ4_9GAMM|nr:hypothetical protein HMPREF9080_00624 [Cardiobacterium valvarum F0432]
MRVKRRGSRVLCVCRLCPTMPPGSHKNLSVFVGVLSRGRGIALTRKPGVYAAWHGSPCGRPTLPSPASGEVFSC